MLHFWKPRACPGGAPPPSLCDLPPRQLPFPAWWPMQRMVAQAVSWWGLVAPHPMSFALGTATSCVFWESREGSGLCPCMWVCDVLTWARRPGSWIGREWALPFLQAQGCCPSTLHSPRGFQTAAPGR